jgi:hypothetical protein
MDGKIIFDAATKSFPWQQLWAAAGAFAFGCVLIALKKLKWLSPMSEKWGYFMIVCALLMAGYDPARWYTARRGQLRALASGEYEVVQGPVENFHPMAQGGSSDESFTISGQVFSYSDYDESETATCFTQTKANGGPIQAGMLLRVKFVNHCILQIEAESQGIPVSGISSDDRPR